MAQDDNTGFSDDSVSLSYTVESDGNYYVGITTPSNNSAGYQLVLNSNGTIEQLPTVPGLLDASLSPSTINTSQSTTVAVTVTDARNGDPVEGATVTVSDLGLSATTNASGVATLSLDTGTSGEYPVTVSADDYTDVAVTLTTEAALDGTAVVGSTSSTDGSGPFAGDSLHQDVNGDGSVTLADVTGFFANYNSEAVQRNPSLFDFNGDGSVTLADVTTLFNAAT